MTKTVHRACTLCEATCGLTFEVDGDRIVSVEPDHDDPFSKGYVCPKGIAIAEIHDDPDRLRQPMKRVTAPGDPEPRFEPIGWDEALDLAGRRLAEVRDAHGGNAVGFYWGNPNGNNHGATLSLGALTNALGTRNRFSSGSQDANPRLVVAQLLYGASSALPVPDVDRTDYFLCVGANPLVSNGSVMTAPDMRGRLRAVRERGGKVVVIDPRRTETALKSDEHVSVRPGTDAALLLSIVHELVETGNVDGAFLEESTSGWSEIVARLAPFAAAEVEDYTGVAAPTIRRLAEELAAANAPVVYSRMGVCAGRHATLATYATDLLNVVLGRLGREGGFMFPTPPFELGELARVTGLDGFGRWRSRVKGLPETIGDLPATAMADEIEIPGDGQIRAMVTFAGNPVSSVPNGRRLAGALSSLEFMVSIDIYLNETTRHADLVLPPCWSLAEDHIDLIFSAVSVRNVARWSPPVVERSADEKADWEIVLALCERLGGGPIGDPWVDGLLSWLKPLGIAYEPTAFADLVLRMGPYGDKFLPWSDGLNMAKLREAPHGIDLGPLEPGIGHRLRTADKRVHLADPLILEAFDAQTAELECEPVADELLLIGRRELRSNNSWMHNSASLVSGRDRCTLLVHPKDAQRTGVADGEPAELASRVYRGRVLITVSDEIMPGVVSLPHGWGHRDCAPWQRVAGEHAGVSANDWTDDEDLEPIIGQSILNGVPVRLGPVAD